MDKMHFRSIMIFFFVWMLLFHWIMFIPESYSHTVVPQKEKTKIVKKTLSERERFGEALAPELARELKRACNACKEKDWSVLGKSLDRIIAMGSKTSDSGPATFTPQEKEILAGADERIEKYRMGTAHLSVVTIDGRPVPNTKVTIEQTGHEFLFGCNRSLIMQSMIAARKYGTWILPRWEKKYSISDKEIEIYTRKFIEFANYTSLNTGWSVYEKRKSKINCEPYDKEIKWLHDKGFKVLAHSLVWNNNTPEWVPRDCKGIAKAVEKRVRDFVSHYKGKFDYFLVFNEAAKPFRPIFAKDKMTKCFREIGHIAFVSKPFKIAREVNPTAKLMINEVAIVDHRGFPHLLRHLKDSNANPLYDIIGIQSHMHNKLWRLDQVWKACEVYSTFGVPIHFTEVSVLSGTPMNGKNHGMKTTPDGERKQAEYAVNLYTTLFSHPSVEAIQWWNLTDHGAWKRVPAGLLRKDMSPKPAYNALIYLIKKKWWTKVEKTTSKQGECEFKGFLGDYKITITPNAGQPRIFNIKLTKKGKRSFLLVM